MALQGREVNAGTMGRHSPKLPLQSLLLSPLLTEGLQVRILFGGGKYLDFELSPFWLAAHPPPVGEGQFSDTR